MKMVNLMAILAMAMIVNSPQAGAKDKYWKPKCEKGAELEQRSGKQEYRCRRDAAIIEEFRVGRCERNQRLRRTDQYGYNYSCQGTTIGRQGGAGTFSTQIMFECPPGYEPVKQAESTGRTCVKEKVGTAYEPPIF
ncbi:MAG: hypothetical protein QGI68_02225 [Pseudomonadales bacterium]|jgi:hypothetical protein|nr:hypothetical protein [Pseudomonadales bacterium]MDP7144220.1 hypothetical protein [Pseudomonadales bacterium]MDP7358851.1 hypothetical protein [Pseudomonadales bacterium]MDP7594369.1 hypothetical protein [Pseudomonadales bacterium]HJN49076.1 hypothetical protein [Pseudomonadales bacterium]|tara:strand:- start:213 stop:620 length:408 start_codon:yes stop_codon:yes gene_type:complete